MARRRGSKDQLTVFGALEAEHPATQVDDLADSIRKAVASHPALRVLTAVAAVSGVQGDFVPHPAYTRQGRGVDFPGYSFSKSAQVMCRPCSRTAVLEHNGYHPKLAGLGYTIPLWSGDELLGHCLLCGCAVHGVRSGHGGIR